MKFILGQKSAMSQLFGDDDKVIPVTIVKAGPCTVTQIKTTDSPDGYNAVQLGFGQKKALTKPLTGHLKDLPLFRFLKEFRTADKPDLTRGQVIKANVFQPGDQVKVTGISKGRGFQGVVKRHGFSGSPASHGHKDQLRMPGSIGSTGPQRVFKGVRMAGQMGDEQVTITNLEVVKVDSEKDLLYLKGALPGAKNGLLLIQGPGELRLVEEVKEPIVEQLTKDTSALEDSSQPNQVISDNQENSTETK